MGIHPMKGVWKSARMELGALCVMTSGILKMPSWLADSWDSPDWVYNYAINMLLVYIGYMQVHYKYGYVLKVNVLRLY